MLSVEEDNKPNKRVIRKLYKYIDINIRVTITSKNKELPNEKKKRFKMEEKENEMPERVYIIPESIYVRDVNTHKHNKTLNKLNISVR